jgi:hypothetical protein
LLKNTLWDTEYEYREKHTLFPKILSFMLRYHAGNLDVVVAYSPSFFVGFTCFMTKGSLIPFTSSF